jgi:uncharacterized protein YjbI with pentapeptide repeats
MEANREHLALIQAGVEPWNEWRRQNPYIIAPDLEDADLRGRDLTGVNVSTTNLCAVRLDGCRLDGASMIGATLSGTRMAGASLRQATLVEASFQGTDLTGADLSRADLSACLIRRAQLDDANLEGANLSEACFAGGKPRGTRFAGARVRTTFSHVDLSGARDLERVIHVGPSSIGVDTLYRSAGRSRSRFCATRGCRRRF